MCVRTSIESIRSGTFFSIQAFPLVTSNMHECIVVGFEVLRSGSLPPWSSWWWTWSNLNSHYFLFVLLGILKSETGFYAPLYTHQTDIECCLPWDVFRTPMAFSSSFLKHAGCWMLGLHQIQQIPLLQEGTDRLTHPCGEADPLSNRIQLCCCIPLFVQIHTGTNLSFISKC